LTPQFFHIHALALDLGLIGVYLTLLIRLPVFLSLQLIADQNASPQSKSSADRRSGARMANSRADESTCGSSAKRANTGAFFTRAETTAGAADADKTEQTNASDSVNCLLHRYLLKLFN
jgi:hypothetical protein